MDMPMSPAEYASACAHMSQQEINQLSMRVDNLEQRVAELEKIIQQLSKDNKS